MEQGAVRQDGRDVRTKFSKTFTTWFFPIGGGAQNIVEAWIDHLKKTLHWGPDDPLFPATKTGLSDHGTFVAAGLSRSNWNTTQPIREIFKSACATTSLPYFNPHSLRDMLAQQGEQVCRSPEEFKAWSQNLGHEKVLTTLNSYGKVPDHRQAKLLRDMSLSSDPADELDRFDMPELIAALARKQGIG